MGSFLLRLVVLLARGLGALGLVVGWAAYVWFTGRSWRHGTHRRLVRREVRAAGNWLATTAVAAVVWRPVATGVVLVVLGGSLVGTAYAMRRRDRLRHLTHLPDREPIRVRATVGLARRLTTSSGGR